MCVIVVDSSHSGCILVSDAWLSSSSHRRCVTMLRKLPARPPFMGLPHFSLSLDPPSSEYKLPTSLWKGEGQQQHPLF
jgi:hypothetical protein